MPALIAAALVVLGAVLLLAFDAWTNRIARTIGALLVGLVAGCLVCQSMYAANDSHWSFNGGWWLWVVGVLALGAALFAMPSRDSSCHLQFVSDPPAS